jgi:hypothetical protein
MGHRLEALPAFIACDGRAPAPPSVSHPLGGPHRASMDTDAVASAAAVEVWNAHRSASHINLEHWLTAARGAIMLPEISPERAAQMYGEDGCLAQRAFQSGDTSEVNYRCTFF